MEDGWVSPVDEGTPQGGPLSPLLSNLVLDERDRELEWRGHRFVRYADDSNIYVGSERAGQRVMESGTHFIRHRLKLKVNQAKSAVAQPGQRKFLGFSFTGEREPRRRIAPKAIARFKERIREPTRRTRGISLRQMVQKIATYLPGWLGYFGTVKRLRCCTALKRGYAADSGRWCGNSGSADGQGSASFANGRSARTWRHKPPGVLTAPGESRTRPRWPLPYPTPTLLSSGFRLWSYGPSLIRRTAVCGPACTVVWQGRRGDLPPYADCLEMPRTGAHDLLRALVRQRQVGSHGGAVKPEDDQCQRNHSQNRVPVQIFVCCPRLSLHLYPPSLFGRAMFRF
jgi:hypothetical protein